MKNKHFLLVFIISFLACSQDILVKDVSVDSFKINNSTDKISDYQTNELINIYNPGIHTFCRSLAKALKNKKLRESIKNEALLKSDGDFDVVWKKIKDNQIDNESTKDMIVKNLNDSDSGKSNLKKLETFTGLFKQLQLSVPVHIEDWNTETYIPAVAFRELTDKGVSDYLVTYDKDGKQGKIEKEDIPNIPVIVVNLNERSDDEGNILPEYDKNFQKTLKSAKATSVFNQMLAMPSNGPTGFSGIYQNNYIMLSWNYFIPDGNEHTIQIEKENGSGYSLIDEVAAIDGSDNYFDYNIQTGNTYTYRIRSRVYNYSTGQTTYSSYTPAIIVSTGSSGIPQTPTITNIQAQNQNEIELFWSYPSTSSISGFKLYKRIPGSGQQYGAPTYIPASSRYYLDLDSKVLGAMYSYKLVAYNSYGESGEAIDVMYNPYRYATDRLYLTRIDFLDLVSSDIESWDLGNPEVRISLSMKTSPTSAPTLIFENAEISESSTIKPRDPNRVYKDASFSYNVDLLGGPWNPTFYKSVVNLNFIEHDGYNWLTGWKTISLSVKVPIKVAGQTIEVTASTNIENSVKNTEYNMGDGYICYWNPCSYNTQVLGNLKVYFSTTPQ